MKFEPTSSVGPSDIEELMMPYWDRPPETDWDLVDIVQDIVMSMDEPHRTIIELVFYDRLSFSELASTLGIKAKSHAWRKTQRALKEFKLAFENHPQIKKEEMMKQTWDENSFDALEHHWLRAGTHGEFWREQDLAMYLLNTQKRIAKFIQDIINGEPNMSFDDLDSYMGACGNLAASHIRTSLKSDIHAIHNLLCSKQRDYGHENITLSGEIGLAVRMMDKIARLNNLLNRDGKNVMNEPLVDTWCDILGYATVYHMFRNGTFTTPLKEMETA